MAIDIYGRDLKIGDIVQKIGWSDQFTIIDINPISATELINSQGQTRVNSKCDKELITIAIQGQIYNENRVISTTLIKIG